MYPVPPRTSSFSGTLRFWINAPRSQWGPSHIQRDEHARFVVGYKRSTSCRSDDCYSHLCIRQDSLSRFLGRSPCLATVSHNSYYSKRYPPYTSKAHLDSRWPDPMSLEMCQKHRGNMAFRGWNCAISTYASWHRMLRLEMRLCWWVPVEMLPAVGRLGLWLSGTSHGCSSLIWLMSNVRYS